MVRTWVFLGVLALLLFMIDSRFDAVESELGIECQGTHWYKPFHFTCKGVKDD